MIRQLLCQKCGANQKLHPEDKRSGYKMRTLFVSVVKPEHHGITVNGKFHPLANLFCDSCDEVITASTVIATTMWREDNEGEPGQWEMEYGTIIPPEAAALERKLV